LQSAQKVDGGIVKESGVLGIARLCAIVVVCWGISLGFASTAAADPAAQARFHDELARKHYERGNYEGALREFFLEQRVAPNPRIAFNIALCFQELKREADAFLYFQEYLESGDVDPERQADAKKAIAELESRTARVLVKSDPPGADIYIDQREHGSYGKTPRLLAVDPGQHKVSVELAGYRIALGEVATRKGEQAELVLTPVKIVGDVKVDANVKGQAFVRTAAGVIAAQGPTPFAAQIAPGEYTVSVEAPGYVSFRGLTAVLEGQTATVSAALSLAPEATGDITVTSNITGAVVEIDGQPMGFSPSMLPGVAVGKHKMRVRAPSLLPWEGEVEVGAEERSWVTVTLEEPPQLKHSSATWLAGGLGVAALVGGGVLGVMASSAHSDFEEASVSTDRSDLRDRGVGLNAASDVLLVTGVIATAAAVVLYFTTAENAGRPSAASATRSKR
jgi:hypothetical protein